MNPLVIDASVAVKWVVDEDGTAEALLLRNRYRLIAPDLLIPELANILWKKVRRHELLEDEALLAAQLLQGVDIELLPTRAVLAAATRMAIALDHPAYDCVYLAQALDSGCRLATADESLVRKVRQSHSEQMRNAILSLAEAAGMAASTGEAG